MPLCLFQIFETAICFKESGKYELFHVDLQSQSAVFQIASRAAVSTKKNQVEKRVLFATYRRDIPYSL